MKRLKKNNVSSGLTNPDVTGAGLEVSAATILVIIGIGYGVETGKRCVSAHTAGYILYPEEAYQVLQATLIEVSTNLNQGIAQVKENANGYEKS